MNDIISNYEKIAHTLFFRAIWNYFFVLIFGGALLYYILKINKDWKKIRSKKYVNMYNFCYMIVLCVLLAFFMIMFSKSFYLHAITRVAFVKDAVEQEICTEEIIYSYSNLTDKTVKIIADDHNEKERYYIIEDIPGVEGKHFEHGDRCIIEYCKYSKVVLSIELKE